MEYITDKIPNITQSFADSVIITEEMENIFDLIDQGKNLFITGKAGSGKTTFLKLLTEKYKAECIVTAPTGVAAVNAGGMTIHSMFSLPIGVQNPNEKIPWRLPSSKSMLLRAANILIIDEISMVRCDLMDAIDKRLRSARKCKRPFGGMQVLMFGDLMQLPPVVTNDEANVLYEYYDDFFFFNSLVFKTSSFQVCELSEVFRQTDSNFISLLNNVRNGLLDDESKRGIIEMLNRKDVSDGAVHLCALKNVAESYNRRKLGEPTHIISATITGDFNPKNARCDLELYLKPNARVMITKNDTFNHQYYNGTLGYVEKIESDKITIMTDEGIRVFVEPETIESHVYEVKVDTDEDGNLKTVIERKVTGRCVQFPLTLAYAITIHKSQGLTFDHVVLHIREIFQTGQLYTALSRCRKMENVSIDSEITDKMLVKNESIDFFNEYVKKNNNVYGFLI